MKTWFDILGVTQNADLRAVKRAYAGKLKSIRQDEDPAGFMELREAYEHGRAQAQYLENVALQEAANTEQEHQSPDDALENVDPSNTKTNITGNAFRDAVDDNADVNSNASDQQATPNAAPEVFPTDVEQLMGEIEKLVASPWGGASVSQWGSVLDDNRLDDIDVYADFEVNLLNYLLHIHGYFADDEYVESKISEEVGKAIFMRFGWDKKHHSVFVDPSAFQWLAAKLSMQTSELKEKKFERREKDKFTTWFDGIGKFVIVGAIFVFFVLINLLETKAPSKPEPKILEVSKILSGEAAHNWDCEELESFALNSIELRDHKSTVNTPKKLSDDPQELIKQLADMGKEGETVMLPKPTLDASNDPLSAKTQSILGNMKDSTAQDIRKKYQQKYPDFGVGDKQIRKIDYSYIKKQLDKCRERPKEWGVHK